MMPQRIRLLSIPGIPFSMLSMLIALHKQSSSGQTLCILGRAPSYMIRLKNQFPVNVADMCVCAGD